MALRGPVRISLAGGPACHPGPVLLRSQASCGYHEPGSELHLCNPCRARRLWATTLLP